MIKQIQFLINFKGKGVVTSLNNIFGGGLNVSLNILFGIILLPIYLSLIDESIFGIWLATGNILVVLSSFESGIPMLTTQKLIKHLKKDEKNIFTEVLTSSLILISILCVVLTLISILIFVNLQFLFDITSESSYDLIDLE